MFLYVSYSHDPQKASDGYFKLMEKSIFATYRRRKLRKIPYIIFQITASGASKQQNCFIVKPIQMPMDSIG